jgi:fluoride exporter
MSSEQWAREAVDPDVDLRVRGQRRELREHPQVLVAISLGGMLGASGRYSLELAWPHEAGTWPWATLVSNLSGCLLIGLLMVYVIEAGPPHPLLRPFLGVGVLGGYTTFSTYAVETDRLLLDGHLALGVGYLFGTVVAALTAVAAGVSLARWSLEVRRRSTRRRGGAQ